MTRLTIALIVVSTIAVGCYSTAQFIPSSNQRYSPRASSWTSVQVFSGVPRRPFEDIGFLQGEFDSSVRSPSGNIEILRQKAFSVGADAIINLKCDPGSGWGPGYCQGTAIRFTN